jgi:hypothetical protein
MYDGATQRHVALKDLANHSISTEHVIHASRLSHPNIVSLESPYECSVTRGEQSGCFAGRSHDDLQELLTLNKGGFTEHLAIQTTCYLVCLIQRCIDHIQMAHFDLKPSPNILVQQAEGTINHGFSARQVMLDRVRVEQRRHDEVFGARVSLLHLTRSG